MAAMVSRQAAAGAQALRYSNFGPVVAGAGGGGGFYGGGGNGVAPAPGGPGAPGYRGGGAGGFMGTPGEYSLVRRPRRWDFRIQRSVPDMAITRVRATSAEAPAAPGLRTGGYGGAGFSGGGGGYTGRRRRRRNSAAAAADTSVMAGVAVAPTVSGRPAQSLAFQSGDGEVSINAVPRALDLGDGARRLRRSRLARADAQAQAYAGLTRLRAQAIKATRLRAALFAIAVARRAQPPPFHFRSAALSTCSPPSAMNANLTGRDCLVVRQYSRDF